MQKIVFNIRKIIWLITFVGAIFLCFSLVKLIESENFKNHTGSVRAIKFPFQKQLIPSHCYIMHFDEAVSVIPTLEIQKL